MSGFVAWAGAVCMAAAGCTALHLLVGNKGTGKLFSLLTTAFFLCAVLSPLTALRGIRLPEAAETEQTVDLDALVVRQLKTATERLLLQTVNTALASHQLEVEKVVVKMDTLEDGSISISNIALYAPTGNDLHAIWIKQIAEQRLGMEVEVHDAE